MFASCHEPTSVSVIRTFFRARDFDDFIQPVLGKSDYEIVCNVGNVT